MSSVSNNPAGRPKTADKFAAVDARIAAIEGSNNRVEQMLASLLASQQHGYVPLSAMAGPSEGPSASIPLVPTIKTAAPLIPSVPSIPFGLSGLSGGGVNGNDLVSDTQDTTTYTFTEKRNAKLAAIAEDDRLVAARQVIAAHDAEILAAQRRSQQHANDAAKALLRGHLPNGMPVDDSGRPIAEDESHRQIPTIKDGKPVVKLDRDGKAVEASKRQYLRESVRQRISHLGETVLPSLTLAVLTRQQLAALEAAGCPARGAEAKPHTYKETGSVGYFAKDGIETAVTVGSETIRLKTYAGVCLVAVRYGNAVVR